MDIDSLYRLVTEAIRRAEALEDLDVPDARRAFLEVSRLEERIASLLPLADYEGVIARRGAVRAAINAHEFGLAQELATRFEAEDGIDDALAADLAALKAQASAMADRENRPTGKPIQRAVAHGHRDIKKRVSASDQTQEAIVTAFEAATAADLMDRGSAPRRAKRAVRVLLGESPPKPKKSV
jgi:hypothetical protein